jgi:RNA polymerase sigma factor (sigma-70 family)
MSDAAFVEFSTDWPIHRKQLMAYARRRLQETGVPTADLSSEDVAHVTYLILWRKRHQVDVPGHYMYRVAQTIIHRAALNQGRFTHVSDVLDDLRAPHRESPEHVAVRAEVFEHLEAARRKLSLRQQLVIGLLFDEGLSYKEVAETLQISEGSVAQYRARALKALEEALRDSGYDDAFPYAVPAAAWPPSATTEPTSPPPWSQPLPSDDEPWRVPPKKKRHMKSRLMVALWLLAVVLLVVAGVLIGWA